METTKIDGDVSASVTVDRQIARIIEQAQEQGLQLTGDLRGTLKLWDPTTGAEMLSLRGRAGRLCAPLWSPDGTRIAAASDGKLLIWDATAGFDYERRPAR